MSSTYTLQTTLENLSATLARSSQEVIEAHLKEALKSQADTIVEDIARKMAKNLRARLTHMYSPINGRIEVILIVDNIEISKETL